MYTQDERLNDIINTILKDIEIIKNNDKVKAKDLLKLEKDLEKVQTIIENLEKDSSFNKQEIIKLKEKLEMYLVRNDKHFIRIEEILKEMEKENKTSLEIQAKQDVYNKIWKWILTIAGTLIGGMITYMFKLIVL